MRWSDKDKKGAVEGEQEYIEEWRLRLILRQLKVPQVIELKM